jgi:hypothetical protein
MSSILDMNEEEWTNQKAEYRRRLGTIIIPLDISATVAKGLLSRIDAFFSEIRLEVSEVEGRKESIDNIIREWERTKIAGGNELERKKRASNAIQEYPLGDGNTTNLYDLQRQLTERLSYLLGVLDILNGKQSRLITITGVLKLERELSPHSDISWNAGQS